MATIAIEITRRTAASWDITPDGIAANIIQDPYYRGTRIGDNVTIKSTNGAVYFKDINYQYISYIDEVTPANSVPVFASAFEVVDYLKEVGFFDVSSGGGSGVTMFRELSDTFASFVGYTLNFIRINAAGTALEPFAMAIVELFTDLADAPDTIEAGKYLRGNAAGTALEFTDGLQVNQDNKGRKTQLGYYTPAGTPPTSEIVSRVNSSTIVISEIQTPVILYMVSTPSELGGGSLNSKLYGWLFLAGKGTYGVGGTTVVPSMFHQLPPLNLTPEDIENDPNSVINNLDPVVDGDFITKANTTFWDFNDSGSEGVDGGVKSYYFSYTDDGVLYYALFVGTPGMYGDGATPFVEGDFVTTTNGGVQPEIPDYLAFGETRFTAKGYQWISGVFTPNPSDTPFGIGDIREGWVSLDPDEENASWFWMNAGRYISGDTRNLNNYQYNSADLLAFPTDPDYVS